ncbi:MULTISPECIES: hypothetical protein [Acinetobacter calcoaceticus/baumannii complex]|nr:hypothetical protein [Acinetobacter baumannii]
MTTIGIKIMTDGRRYEINPVHYDKIENLALYARDNMSYPCCFHFLSHIDDPETFKETKRNLIKEFERELKRQFKSSPQECPEVLVLYSIEFKYTTNKEVEGGTDAYDTSRFDIPKAPFLHIHFYVIADCRRTHPGLFRDKAIASLDNLGGLRAGRYLLSKNNELFKKLKGEYFDDTFQRLLYVGKVEQKSPEIPFRKKFGTSKVPN